MKRIVYIQIGVFVILSSLLLGCVKEYTNPYDNIENPVDVTTSKEELEPASIAGLHANVFRKTCANSGCHDGTFEPDYRTIESTYNTLVFHPVIKNDPQDKFEYRVMPGSADQSLLVARLIYDIDGNSGIMPLAIEPDSDWKDKKEQYIQNIKDWINSGAADIFGNSPSLANGLPQMQGIAAKSGTWIERDENGQGRLQVKRTLDVLDLYIALDDDDTIPQQLSNTAIRFAENADEFSAASSLSLELMNSPVTHMGYFGEEVKYHHKITINPQDYGQLGTTVYFRIYTQDDTNPLTEIPSDAGAGYIKKYFSFKIVE